MTENERETWQLIDSALRFVALLMVIAFGVVMIYRVL